ncbi:MAG: Ig-like domain-containing protein, partial [Peptostreptococcaceae bacterium]
DEHSSRMQVADVAVGKMQSDYEGLRKVIIDENISVNLQNQINKTNSELEHSAKQLKEHIQNHPSGEDNQSIQSFYRSSKNGKKIVMLGDSTVISGGKISERISLYQGVGQWLYNCSVVNSGVAGKTLSGWVKNEMQGVISSSSDVDMYVFCLGINDLMNLGRTEEQIRNDFKTAIDGLLDGTNAYILLRLPYISNSKREWQKILRNIYMSYIGYSARVDVIDIPSLVAQESNKSILLADDVHLVTDGYYMVADELVARICNKNTIIDNMKRQMLFRGIITKINSNILEVTSSYNKINTYNSPLVYINNTPYDVKRITSTDETKCEIQLCENYNGNVGIVTMFENSFTETMSTSNPNDWYNLYNLTDSFKGRLWLAFKIPDEIKKNTGTYNIKVKVSAMGIVGDGAKIRVTPILRNTSISDSNGQVFGTNMICSPFDLNENSLNDYYFNVSVNSNNYSYLVVCVDSISVANFSTVRIGNVNIFIDNIKVNNSMSVVDSGTPSPKLCTNPIVMTHDSTIKLLMKLGLIDSNMYNVIGENKYVSANTPVESVSLNTPSHSLMINETFQLIATVLPATATNKNVTWSSSNTNIATVSANGLVTAKSIGSVTITATTQDGNKTSTCNITVSEEDEVIPPSDEYSLVLELDATGKTGSATVWEDLTTLNGDMILSNFTNDTTNGWNNDALYFSETKGKGTMPIGESIYTDLVENGYKLEFEVYPDEHSLANVVLVNMCGNGYQSLLNVTSVAGKKIRVETNGGAVSQSCDLSSYNDYVKVLIIVEKPSNKVTIYINDNKIIEKTATPLSFGADRNLKICGDSSYRSIFKIRKFKAYKTI